MNSQASDLDLVDQPAPDFRRLKVTLRYDGAGFAGWQVQPHARTVQGVLQETLSRIASRPIRITGAARTDAGVHALGQVFSCDWPAGKPRDSLRRSLSKMLGPEIRIERVEEAPPGFNARHDAVAKRYAYTLSLAKEPDPFTARYAWCLPSPVNLDRLAALLPRVMGTHDFAGYQAASADIRTTVRTLHSVELKEGGVIEPIDGNALWRIEFHGDGFLYKMVRNLTGTLADIARSKAPESTLTERLHSPGPFRGHTAPPHGLALLEVLFQGQAT